MTENALDHVGVEINVSPCSKGVVDDEGFFFPWYFPFVQKNWFLKIWWLPFLSIVPPVAFCLLRGWRVNIVRRICAGEEEPLPDIAEVWRFFVDGAVLILMTFIYTIIPALIIIGFSLDGIGDFIDDLFTIFSIGSIVDALSFMVSEFIENILVICIKYGWIILSLPLYRAAFFRYCQTGKMRSFFAFHSHIRFIATNIKEFLNLYFFMFILGVTWWFLTALLLSTGIGLLIFPFMFPFYYWSTAYAFGRLARNVEI